MIRRHLLVGGAGGAVCASGAAAVAACTPGADRDAAARHLRRPFAAGTRAGDRPVLLRELVRFATLAPSSHNTQCWSFALNEGRSGRPSVTLTPDFSRRCPVVDPDDHHLYVSLGCATENLVQAAPAGGLHADVQVDTAGDGRIVVNLAPTMPQRSALFHAMARRQCTRGDYDGRPLATEELQLLAQAGTGNGVHVMLLTERAATERVLAYVVAANTAQMSDPAFMAELTAWIRFSAAEAARTGDGLFAGASGQPPLPRWLGRRLMGWVMTPTAENDRYAAQIRNAAGIAIFVSAANDRAHWVEVGRCYERFALQATALGIRNAFLNQPVEVGAIRPQFAAAFGLDAPQRPDLVVRFGRGPVLPMSMRRPVAEVLIG